MAYIKSLVDIHLVTSINISSKRHDITFKSQQLGLIRIYFRLYLLLTLTSNTIITLEWYNKTIKSIIHIEQIYKIHLRRDTKCTLPHFMLATWGDKFNHSNPRLGDECIQKADQLETADTLYSCAHKYN